MATLPIILYGTQVLRQKAAPIDSITEQEQQLLIDMQETMYHAPGIGLAAPQIGISQRIIVIDISVGRDPDQFIPFINPKIIEARGSAVEEEGCLSLPSFAEPVKRAEWVKVVGLTPSGEERLIEADGVLARAFQHELDHLNGMLFIDRISSVKRMIIKQKVKKKMDAREWFPEQSSER